MGISNAVFSWSGAVSTVGQAPLGPRTSPAPSSGARHATQSHRPQRPRLRRAGDPSAGLARESGAARNLHRMHLQGPRRSCGNSTHSCRSVLHRDSLPMKLPRRRPQPSSIACVKRAGPDSMLALEAAVEEARSFGHFSDIRQAERDAQIAGSLRKMDSQYQHGLAVRSAVNSTSYRRSKCGDSLRMWSIRPIISA